ncbi:hypothetical protein MNEG_5737 [Monoraphidium neglectum]|uniref:LysM domain-containing protein n=1 Tax=Monoraphidium neglectum TaxID=145388 RepID=A0A0D2N970_9CHLO|nr:hypothetical protein MNEG_5737 [Monoraphidium neglectum]KIZ02221.1 hypothetical protein MNEG_5737 [Monoraphidium neglectum]|eukprot:XP_013901240.1 hypothetical protein MNEG_5737 [Monoraphidium neglectum]
MPLSTARWLASKEGWSMHPSPSAAALETPHIAAYFAAALLATMYRHGGRRRRERFAILAFHAGPRAAAAAAAARRRRARWQDAAPAADQCAGGGGVVGSDGGGDSSCGDGKGWEDDSASSCGGEDTRDDEDSGSLDGGGGGGGALAGFWDKYQRAKGLVDKMSKALELRRRAEGGGGGGGGGERGGGWGGGCGAGGMMHLVHQGETLNRIAVITGTSVADLLAANPDLPGESALQPNDLIALPIPAVVPRLHALRPGDSLRSLSRAYGVPLGRLLARNPELCDPRALQPGWVVAIPGLRGDSAPTSALSGGSGGGGAGGGSSGGGGGAALAQLQLAQLQLLGGGGGRRRARFSLEASPVAPSPAALRGVGQALLL